MLSWAVVYERACVCRTELLLILMSLWEMQASSMRKPSGHFFCVMMIYLTCCIDCFGSLNGFFMI